jgi:hypothetical protein
VDTAAIWNAGLAVVARLRAAGHQAWLVGGCVRDHLLGRPFHDADVASDAEPDEVERLFTRSVAVGKSFGVVRVESPSGIWIEVAALRADDRYIDGRRPVAVRRGTLREDAERRDLTVNALYHDGEQVIDLVGGRADLAARVLRGIGEPAQRIAEDRLRVLRTLRFAAVLGFAIEERTWAAVCASDLAGVSRERILDEAAKAMAHGAAGRLLRLAAAAGRLGEIAPLVPVATADVLDRLGQADPVVAWAAWLNPLGAAAAQAWIATQPVPAAWRRDVPWLITHAATVGNDPLAARRRALRDRRGPALVALAAASDPGNADTYRAWLSEEASNGPIPVTAGDLIRLGVAPGPALGACLAACEDAWLEGRWRSGHELPAQVAAWQARKR